MMDLIHQPKILGFIPARQGSKRVPHKNIKDLAGKPLIAWTIEMALEANLNMDVLVSTDSEEIASIAQQAGAEVPFLRPAFLAEDGSSTFDAIAYTLGELQKMGRTYEYLMLLQPTSPLRQSFHLEEAFWALQQQGGQSVISVSEIEHPIEWTMVLDESQSLDAYIAENADNLKKRSQEFSKRYRINGAVFCAEIKALLEYQTFYLPKGGVFSYVMDNKYAIDIDELEDFEYAEFLKLKYNHSANP